MTSTSTTDFKGQVGDWHLIRELGKGQYSTVYLG